MRNNYRLILLFFVLLASGAYFAFRASDRPNVSAEADHADSEKHSEKESGDEHGHAHGEGEEEHAEASTISDRAAKNLQIDIEKADRGIVQERISVSGRVTLNQNSTAQIKARFPGVIRSVAREPGEIVQANEGLAKVESNESLQVYEVKAPIAGTIITRNASLGQVTGEEPLFVVANLESLWAELFVFSKDGEKLRAGQKVFLQCLDDPAAAESRISLVLPTAEASSQMLVARAVIDNTDHHWRSGTNIRADIVVAEHEVALAVRTEAIQRMEGKNVVFVAEGENRYRAQTIEIGASDSTWTEIKSGLAAGQNYVSKNSFVVKADIGKAGAEHEH